MNLRLAATLLISLSLHAQDDFPLTEESKPQPNVPKGQMLKDTYTAKDGSVFPGTEREYQLYLPANLDTTKPAPFMVFQDGVIYNAPTVFDNLIAKKDLPPMIGIFIKPGVVPAANENALPRFNRSYEYDSVTDTYSRFLIDEFLPAIVAKHQLNLSADPNARAISGNSSGGICAFMVAWHRPDQFRRVFTGVGTYVGIHGADQLPVLVRKHEPKPLRVFLQSGENDNNLYCGDWWMANQMMERSLTWNGYDVNHAWGKGGHNAKHASQIFPEVLRWLWKGYPEEPVKANPRGDAKWRGYEVVGAGEWLVIKNDQTRGVRVIKPEADGTVLVGNNLLLYPTVYQVGLDGSLKNMEFEEQSTFMCFAVGRDGLVYHPDDTRRSGGYRLGRADAVGKEQLTVGLPDGWPPQDMIVTSQGDIYYCSSRNLFRVRRDVTAQVHQSKSDFSPMRLALSPDQSTIYASSDQFPMVWNYQIQADGSIKHLEAFGKLCRRYADDDRYQGTGGLCVDTNGWLYVATSLGIQVLDQAGRVNFIIPTPKQPHDVCFGGKDLSELFIACGDTIYKRPTKAKGYISGQMAPIKPPAPKL